MRRYRSLCKGKHGLVLLARQTYCRGFVFYSGRVRSGYSSAPAGGIDRGVGAHHLLFVSQPLLASARLAFTARWRYGKFVKEARIGGELVLFITGPALKRMDVNRFCVNTVLRWWLRWSLSSSLLLFSYDHTSSYPPYGHWRA